jgi:hypothetical protein
LSVAGLMSADGAMLAAPSTPIRSGSPCSGTDRS